MRAGAILALLALAAAPAAADRVRSTARFREAMRARIAEVEAAMAQPGASLTARDAANAGLATMVLGGDPRQAERFVRWAFSHQVMDRQAKDYGTIPWTPSRPEIRDANSIEFCMQPVGPLLLGYGKQLSPEFKRDLRPHLEAAFAAIRRHDVKVTYTNIFLMKATNLLLAGEAIGDEAAARDGREALNRWVEHTREAGIGEFDSPNYYAVDLNSLNMGRLYAARAETREQYRRILDFFWTDIAANYYPGRGTLSGPHSRGYDFLTGHESVENYLFHEGLRTEPAGEKASIGRVYLLLNELAGGYHPPADILKLASLPERTVLSRWRAEGHRDRYNYITPDFAIGSTNHHYGNHDKLINIELGRDPSLPVVYIAPDTTDRPYGKVRTFDRSGHTKPYHLALNAATVQEKGTMLVLLDLDPGAQNAAGTLATNVVMPVRGTSLLLDGRAVAVTAPFERAGRIGSVAAVRAGNAGVAVRVLAAEGFGKYQPEVFLKADPDGFAEGVARLAIYHYRGEPVKFAQPHVRVALLFAAGRCASDAALAELARRAAAAEIKLRDEGNLWIAEALSLEITRDRQTREIVSRKVNGAPPRSCVLCVNGTDWSTRLNP